MKEIDQPPIKKARPNGQWSLWNTLVWNTKVQSQGMEKFIARECRQRLYGVQVPDPETQPTHTIPFPQLVPESKLVQVINSVRR